MCPLPPEPDRPVPRHPPAWFWLAALLLWAAALMLLSLLPLSGMPSPFVNSDKLQHGVAYVVLTGLLAGALTAHRGVSTRPWLHAGLGAFLYGLLLEVLQGLMQLGRTAEWGDLLANGLGVLCACVVFRRLVARYCAASE